MICVTFEFAMYTSFCNIPNLDMVQIQSTAIQTNNASYPDSTIVTSSCKVLAIRTKANAPNFRDTLCACFINIEYAI